MSRGNGGVVLMKPTSTSVTGVDSICQGIVCVGTPRCTALITYGSLIRQGVGGGDAFSGISMRFSFGPADNF